MAPEPETPEEGRGVVHYQISVTGRQAGWFFVVLLVALSLAFFLGMKTGRAARRAPDAVAQLAQASDLPVPTASEERAPTPTVPDVDRKLGFDNAKDAKVKGEPLPTATARPAPAVATATTSAPPAATARPAPSPKPTPPAAGKKEGPLWVQILATQKAATADDMAKRLKKEGFPADVSAVPGKPGWFRVRVGPYADRARAEATAKRIQKVDKSIRNRPLVTP